jgi:hypothetical protein
MKSFKSGLGVDVILMQVLCNQAQRLSDMFIADMTWSQVSINGITK